MDKLKKLKKDLVNLSEEDFDKFAKELQANSGYSSDIRSALDICRKMEKRGDLKEYQVKPPKKYCKPDAWLDGSKGSDRPYDLDNNQDLAEVSKVVYWYINGGYDGNGEALLYKDGLWYLMNLGHCSCYGPFDRVSFNDGKKDPMEFLEKASDEYKQEIREICKKARSITGRKK